MRAPGLSWTIGSGLPMKMDSANDGSTMNNCAHLWRWIQLMMDPLWIKIGCYEILFRWKCYIKLGCYEILFRWNDIQYATMKCSCEIEWEVKSDKEDVLVNKDDMFWE